MSCLAHVINKGHDHHIRSILRSIWNSPLYVEHKILPHIDDGRNTATIYNLTCALVETNNRHLRAALLQHIVVGVVDALKQKNFDALSSFIDKVNSHPVCSDPRCSPDLNQHEHWGKYKKYIKERKYHFKEELVAKTWHPTRFHDWCLDTDEQKEYIQDGIYWPSPPFTQSRAAWDIEW